MGGARRDAAAWCFGVLGWRGKAAAAFSATLCSLRQVGCHLCGRRVGDIGGGHGVGMSPTGMLALGHVFAAVRPSACLPV